VKQKTEQIKFIHYSG